jgi:hypothetical protein
MPLKESAIVIATAAALGVAAAGFAGNEHDDRGKPAKTLYVWAGDQARRAPDFLAVINFDEDSDN